MKPFEVPGSIVVRVTGKQVCHRDIHYRLEEVEFKEYVKGVLAAEWGHDWDMDSLRAGAVAVKQYGARAVLDAGDPQVTRIKWKGVWQDSIIYPGGKWIDAHVYDCDYDQVYRTDLQFEAVDRAVEETWDWWLVDEEGDIVRMFYTAWPGGCEELREDNCMSQWVSKKMAEDGMDWQEILLRFYDGMLIYNRSYGPSEIYQAGH